MPHWLTALVSVGAALGGWRWIVRPMRRGFRELVTLLGQVRIAAAASQSLAREIEALSGAVVQLVIVILDDFKSLRTEHEDLRAHTQELTQLVIDLDADVRRIEKAARTRGTVNEPD